MRSKWNKTLVTVAAALSVLGTAQAAPDKITGAGSTFVYPILSKWAQAYEKKNGVQINYQSIGSGGGIKQIESKTVDFGASDAPLKKDELNKHGMMQFPLIIGGEVMAVHLSGIDKGQLVLDGPTIAKIYSGQIKKWNDPAIAKLNPKVDLPDQSITVVHRSDGSGTTWIFTSYLSKVSNDWKKNVGNGTAVGWPVGVGGKGNEGVASYVQRIDGSIGYVEYAYAVENKMNYTLLKNKDGKVVKPRIDTFQAAASNADWASSPTFYQVLTNEPGPQSWPITGATFALIHKQPKNPERLKTALEFFKWSYENGDDMASELNYIPIPKDVVKLIEQKWQEQVKDKNGQPLWSN